MLHIISGKKGDEYLDEITIEGETDEADADGNGTIDQGAFCSISCRGRLRPHLSTQLSSKHPLSSPPQNNTANFKTSEQTGEFNEWFHDHLDQLGGSKVVFDAAGKITAVIEA